MPEAGLRLAQDISTRLQKDFGFSPVIATEIECYLHGDREASQLDAVIEQAAMRAQGEGIQLSHWESERGEHQYEIALLPVRNAEQVVQQTCRLQQLVHEAAHAQGVTADFSAKPRQDQPGSGMHIHFHLEDAQGRTVFAKKEQMMSEPLAHVLGGLLAAMRESMAIFAPHRDSYARYLPKSHVPVTMSWGANNRTVALRLPDKPFTRARHIEHRVAGTDADPGLVIAAILAAAHCGLQEKSPPGAQMFGDASLPIYALPALPKTLEEALASFRQGSILRRYFGEAFCEDYARKLEARLDEQDDER